MNRTNYIIELYKQNLPEWPAQAHAVAPGLDFVIVEYTVETDLMVLVCVTSEPVTVCTDVEALPVFVT